MQEGKVVVWRGFPNSKRKKTAKGKGERKRWTQWNAEFQRIARRDEKDFLNEQCKEIEENNRMGRTRDLFKKTGFFKGLIYASISKIQDKNNKDLTKAEEIKNR